VGALDPFAGDPDPFTSLALDKGGRGEWIEGASWCAGIAKAEGQASAKTEVVAETEVAGCQDFASFAAAGDGEVAGGDAASCNNANGFGDFGEPGWADFGERTVT